MAETWEQLRRMSAEELYERYLAQIKKTGVPPGVDHYLAEMRHRQIARHTAWTVILTVVIAILTAANVVLVAVTLAD